MPSTTELHRKVRLKAKTMSRLSQFYWLLNEEKMPSALEQQHHYTALSITPEVKQIRKEHLAMVRKAKKDLTKKGVVS